MTKNRQSATINAHFERNGRFFMGFLGRLFGTEKATTELVRSAKDGIDALFYTDEEKAADAREETKAAYGVLIEWFKNNQGQNLSRRVIALSCTFVWLFDIISSKMLKIYAVWSDLDKERVDKTVAILDSGSIDMSGAIMLILGFYFAAPHIKRFADAAIEKMKVSRET